jgi:hypothetical protein
MVQSIHIRNVKTKMISSICIVAQDNMASMAKYVKYGLLLSSYVQLWPIIAYCVQIWPSSSQYEYL